MAQVAYTRSARRDILDILQVIATEAGLGPAVAYDRKFEHVFERLTLYPLAYPERLALGTDVRLGSVKPYVILHKYDRETEVVTILRVLHGHRQITSDFMDLP